MKTYLSGGIEYANNFGKEWRRDLSEWIIKNLNHSIFDPTKESIKFFHEKFPGFERSKLKSLPETEIRDIIGELVKFEIAVVIEQIDYVICYWDDSCSKGAGTQGELTVAKFYNKPVFIVTDKSIQEMPAWIIGCSTMIFFNFENLKSHLIKIFK